MRLLPLHMICFPSHQSPLVADSLSLLLFLNMSLSICSSFYLSLYPFLSVFVAHSIYLPLQLVQSVFAPHSNCLCSLFYLFLQLVLSKIVAHSICLCTSFYLLSISLFVFHSLSCNNYPMLQFVVTLILTSFAATVQFFKLSLAETRRDVSMARQVSHHP